MLTVHTLPEQDTAVERSLAHLASLQKAEGLWPRFLLRRMPEDPAISAFILLQLGGHPPFQSAVRMSDALRWFEQNASFVDSKTRDVYTRAARRCRVPVSAAPAAPVAESNELVGSWS